MRKAMKSDRPAGLCRSWRAAFAVIPITLTLIDMGARADVRLPAIFGNNMVLQQGRPVPIWGWAEPGEQVTVTVAGQKAVGAADADGRWRATLPPLDTARVPATLTVTAKNTVVFTNVVVGEVWICSGQSNMAFKGTGVKDADREVPAANWPLIRLFNVGIVENPSDLPREDVQGSWEACTPTTMDNFSGVGYFFGRELHRRLEVPVGLINSSHGGTSAEGWTRLARLEADPELKASVDLYEKRKADPEGEQRKYQQILARWEQRCLEAKTAGRPEPQRPVQVDPATANSRPGNLWNTMIHPLIPFAFRGVAWYQGEANVARADRYARLFPTLIHDWREQWGQGDFPFLFVQLANYTQRQERPTDHPWARLREAQLKTLAVTNTGMAVAIDLGEAESVHPGNKRDVGLRLAAWALRQVYAKDDVVPSGPLFDHFTVEDGRVRVAFKELGGGLTNGAAAGVQGFAVAGADRRFVWAEARIEGDTVVVSSSDVKQPIAVRYGWAGNPDVSLYNRAGLPASPFRTDDWPFNSKDWIR